MKDSNNNTKYTNVILNSTSRGCKAEPYPFSASAVVQNLFKFNELSNSETCQGLRHWRLLSNLKNNFLKPVRNDMERHTEDDSPKYLSAYYKNEPSPEFVSSPQLTNKFYPQLTHTDSHVSPQLNGSLCITKREGKENVKNLVPECPSALMPLKKKAAFTLAEVLITLGIIGIVAAMTIPTLITNNQKKQTVVKLQRAISVLNQAYKLSYDDVGELGAEETKDFNSLEYFNTYWAPYIKVSTYCNTSSQCGYKSNTPWKYANWSNSTLYPVEPRLRTAFITADGFLYTIFLATWSSGDDVGGEKKALYKVTIDLNGAEGPNRYGRDVFFLSRTQTDGGGIRPFCYEKSNDEVDKDCSTTGLGECCAEKIRRAGWEINRDYPWK